MAVLSPLQVASSRIRNGEVRERNRVTVLSTVIGVLLVALTGSAVASSNVKGMGPDGALSGGGYGLARTPAVNVRPYMSTLTITDDRGRNVVLPAGSDSSPSRPASGDYGPKYFFKNDSHFSQTDNNGSSSASALYFPSSASVAWGFKLSPYLQSIATSGVTPVCNDFANGSFTGYHYSKTPQTADCPFQSSIPGVQFGPSEQLACGYSFRVNAGGATGLANVRSVFNFTVFNY